MATLNVPGSVVKRLEEALGAPLQPAAEGQEARVFFAGRRVVKIYGPHERHTPYLEARNLARAGLGGWVEEIWGDHRLLGYAALVMRRFAGRPFAPERFGPRALAQLAGFLVRLHRLPEPGESQIHPIRERWQRFRKALADLPAAVQALEEIEPRLALLSGVPHSFVHNDLWAGNVLVSADGALLVVDWSRAGGGDPARDLAILTTGSLSLLAYERCLETLRKIVRCYPDPEGLWRRLAVWIPLTFLHDLYWFRSKEPSGFEAALAEKLPRVEHVLNAFPTSPW